MLTPSPTLPPRLAAMPSFLKDLTIRRKTKSHSNTPETNNSSGNTSSTDEPPIDNVSSSTLNSYPDRQSPPTTLGSQKSRSNSHLPGLFNGSKTHLPGPFNGSKTPPLNARPRLPSQQSSGQRYSLAGMPLQSSESVPRQAPATSALAPRVLSVSDGSWVCCRRRANYPYAS